MATLVYILCFITSLACAVLLLRGYVRTKARLLLWSGFAFLGIAVNNGLLFTDRILVPEMDLSIVRTLPALVGIAVLLYGLIWEAE